MDVILLSQAFKFHVHSPQPVRIHHTLSLPVPCRQPIPVLVLTAMHLRTLPTSLKADQCLPALTVPASSSLHRDRMYIVADRSL